jgi:hypothetical protein
MVNALTGNWCTYVPMHIRTPYLSIFKRQENKRLFCQNNPIYVILDVGGLRNRNHWA